MAKHVTIEELRKLRKSEREKLERAMQDDFKSQRVNLSARSLCALYRTLLLDELIEGTFELEG